MKKAKAKKAAKLAKKSKKSKKAASESDSASSGSDDSSDDSSDGSEVGVCRAGSTNKMKKPSNRPAAKLSTSPPDAFIAFEENWRTTKKLIEGNK